MKFLFKNFLFVVLILLIISGIFTLLSQFFGEGKEEITFNQLITDIEEEKIKKITVQGNELLVSYNDDKEAKSRKESEAALSDSLRNYGISEEKIKKSNIEIKEEGGAGAWIGPVLLLVVLPLVFFGLFFFFIMRQARVGISRTFDFTRSKARLFGAEGHPSKKISFKDVAGLKEAKEEVKEIVDFLKNPKKFFRIGARIPRGVLLLGPPGCGKTLLARAVAGESNVPFFHISGSEFVEMFVGVGSARVRDLFTTAKKNAPAIIFIDELDAIGRHRGAGIGGGHDEREQTLNQILVEMDGFERETQVIVISATNRGDILDPALLRPGRFDRRVVLDLPDISDREEILKIHCQGKPLANNVDLREIAERTPGFSGADLANLVNEAAILAARRNKQQIFQDELIESIEKVLLGPERKSHILSKKEKKIAAFHEAGHALVASFTPAAEKIRKVSIVARGLAAGYTLKMPSEESKMKTQSQFLAEIATLLGGYSAEKLMFGEITTGASNDLEKASKLARKLVKEYGMSSLGPISFGDKESLVFLGKEISEQRNYSEKIAVKIDREVEKIIKNAEKEAIKILKKQKKLLKRIAKVLIEKETIEKEEFENLIKKETEEKKKKPQKNYKKKKDKTMRVKIQRV